MKTNSGKGIVQLLEQQKGADVAVESCPEQEVSEPDDDFVQLVDGLAQEMEIIDRAEARATKLGRDYNSLAFCGLKTSDEEFAARAGPSWIEAKQTGVKEWGLENMPIVDLTQTEFPSRCVALQ